MDYREAFRQLDRIGQAHLDLWQKTLGEIPLEADAYNSFRDFIKYGFYRNRTDKLADTYIQYAKAALEKVSPQSEKPSDRVRLLVGRGEELLKEFTRVAKRDSKKVHPLDIMFLQSASNDFIPKLERDEFNVRKFCVRFLREHDLESLFKHLKEIKGVGSKIASLYLRDMLVLYDDSLPSNKKFLDKLSDKQILLVYPIDTWVNKISKKLLDEKGNKTIIAEKLIEECRKLGVSPIYVNHGIWYLGARSQEFLLANLDKISGFKVKI